ncbi:hypothetical protein PoB_002694500 [Plakobranchus ocellatus]|uniref:Uncharacterized protein n=1 Tax=Plakobranchus ocellatus TaxID=259542 RepID=A0AAV3ZZ19_9GAST|nr:hypothetical protein PoB_002694500 [Plakobranchus ocellatus]
MEMPLSESKRCDLHLVPLRDPVDPVTMNIGNNCAHQCSSVVIDVCEAEPSPNQNNNNPRNKIFTVDTADTNSSGTGGAPVVQQLVQEATDQRSPEMEQQAPEEQQRFPVVVPLSAGGIRGGANVPVPQEVNFNNRQNSFPQQGYYSQQSFSQQSFSQQGYPQASYPQPGYPPPGYTYTAQSHPGFYPQPNYSQPNYGYPQGPYPPGPGYPPPGPGGYPGSPAYDDAVQSLSVECTQSWCFSYSYASGSSCSVFSSK